MHEWSEIPLGDVLTLQRGFDLPKAKRKSGSHPVIASTGPVGTHNESMVEGPGVVIGRSGSLGGGQFIEEDFWPLNTTLWVKDYKGNDVRFCYYLLKSIDFTQFNVGSGVPTLNRNHVHPLPVFIPPLREQRAIAHILGTLDDKIELNRRMNQTLEEMARVILKSWFIDFGPTRAKMEGRWRRGESRPGLPAEHYDLFPERLVLSELGETPEGWEVKSLGELFTSKNARLGDEDVPEYSCTNLGLVPRSDRFKKKLSASSSKNKVIRKGDFVFGLSRRVLNFGLMRDDVGCVSPAYRTYSVDTCAVMPDLLERVMRLRSEYFYLAVSASSREGQAISQDALYGLRVSLPNISIQQHLYGTLQRLFLRSNHLSLEATSLANLRDTLLPRLVSGELRLCLDETDLNE